MAALTELPTAMVVAWVLWVAGGLVLMLWFRQRSAAPPRSHPAVRAVSPTGAGRGSGARPAPARQPPGPPAVDAFTELHTLLDAPEDHSPSR